MLDVHPPDGKMHGVGDFFLHLFTITVGLFIALALEGLVERHHKTELREEAEINLRKEMATNQKAITSLLPVMQKEEKTLVILLQFIEAKKNGKPFDFTLTAFGFTNSTLSDASWNTATATGALALMDYDTAQGYAEVYQLQAETMRLERTTLDDFLEIEAHSVYGFDPSKVTAAEATAAEPEVQHALAHLIAWQQFSESLSKAYSSAMSGTK